MRRRTVLRGVGVAAATAVAGCAETGESGDAGDGGETVDRDDGDGPTPTTEPPADPTVRVERTVEPGGFDRPRTLVVQDDGRLRLTPNCGDGEPPEATGTLSASQHQVLERRVLAADVPSLDDHYGPDDPDDDTEVAVSDAPTVALTVSVDGEEATVTHRTRRQTPERLNRLLQLLDRYERRLELPDCE